MNTLQYLVRSEDKSMCIVYKRSILYEPGGPKLAKGIKVTYLWPEETPKGKPKKQDQYQGTIIEYSSKIILHKNKKILILSK